MRLIYTIVFSNFYSTDFKQNFKVSRFFLSLYETKCKKKKKAERNSKNHCLNGFLRGSYLHTVLSSGLIYIPTMQIKNTPDSNS